MPHPCKKTVDEPLLHPRDVLTPRQAEVFRYFFEETRKTGIQPSSRDFCATFGFSPSATTYFLRRLARKGWIAPPDESKVRRALRFLRTSAGTPFRGFVLPADEDDS